MGREGGALIMNPLKRGWMKSRKDWTKNRSHPVIRLMTPRWKPTRKPVIPQKTTLEGSQGLRIVKRSRASADATFVDILDSVICHVFSNFDFIHVTGKEITAIFCFFIVINIKDQHKVRTTLYEVSHGVPFIRVTSYIPDVDCSLS